MDPEQTFLRVHARLSGMLSQLLTPRIRLALEYLYLAGAVALFCLLVVMHTNFVQQPGCSSEFSGIEFGESQLVQIKIISGGLWASKGASYIMDLQNLGRSAEKILDVNGDKFNILASKFWSTWVGPGAKRSKIMFRSWKGEKEYEPQSENAADTIVTTIIPGVSDLKATGEGSVHHPLSAKESFKAAVTYLFRRWYSRVVLFWRNIKQLSDNTLQLMMNREEKLPGSNFISETKQVCTKFELSLIQVIPFHSGPKTSFSPAQQKEKEKAKTPTSTA